MLQQTDIVQGRSIYRPAKAAEYLGVSIQTVYRYAKMGLLPPPIKIGLRASGWMRSDLDSFISKKEQESRGGDAA